MVGSIVEIAKALDVEVIAEGVETEAHAVTLSWLGCDSLQGFALGYPSNTADTGRLLASNGHGGKSRSVAG